MTFSFAAPRPFRRHRFLSPFSGFTFPHHAEAIRFCFRPNQVFSAINKALCRGFIAFAALALCSSVPLAAKKVESEGTAAGDQSTAREQALADALREAVRVGVGVDVASSSKVTVTSLQSGQGLILVKTFSMP